MKLTKLRELGNGRAKGVLPVSGGEGLPVWSLRGRQDGPTLVLTAGVHGCEYVGILALRRLFDSLETASLRGRVLLLPLVNGEGFFTGSKQVVPSDRKNLNRVFPPPPDGTRTERVAQAVVEQVYPQADFLLDLHGGDVNEAMTPLVFFPASAPNDVAEQARSAAKHLEVDYRIPSTAQNGLYSYAAQTGIPALLMEVGGMGLWLREQVELELRSLQSLMGFLGMGPQAVENLAQEEARRMCYAEASGRGLWLPQVAPGQRVCTGEVLGTVEDLDGQELETIRAQWDGIVLYHTLSLGVSGGDMLVTYGQF